MSDPNVYPLPANVPQYVPPPAAASGGIAQRIAQQVAASPGYQGLTPKPTQSVQPLNPQEYKKLPGESWNDYMQRAAKITERSNQAQDIGMAETIPGSGFIKSVLPQKVQDSIDQVKADNPAAVTHGHILGTAGQMMIPGINAVKGAGILPMAANAAINMAPYALGAGLNKYGETGDVGEALKQAGISEAGGTALGTGVGLVGKGISKLIPAIRRGIINQSLSGDIELQTKDWKKIVTEIAGGKAPGSIINRAGPLKEEIIGLANATAGTPLDISTFAGKENFVNEVNSRWDTQVDQQFNQFKQGGGKISDLRNEIYNNPQIQQTINAHPEMIDNLDKIIDTASQTADIQGIAPARKYLRDDVISLGRRQGASDSTYLEGQLGQGVHDVVDDHFVPPELKATYARDKLVKQILSSEDLKIPKAVQSGSQTAARLLAHAAMTAGGSLIPGIGLPIAAVGIGGIVNDLTAGLINKGLGKLATRIVPHLGAMTGAGMATAAGALPGETARLSGLNPVDISNIAGPVGPSMPAGSTLSPQAQPAPAAPVAPVPPPAPMPVIPQGAPPQSAQMPPGSVPIQNAPGPIAPVPIPNAAPQLSPQERAQIQFIQAGQPQPRMPAFNEKHIQDQLDQMYSLYARQYGSSAYSRQDFENSVRNATNNFDPNLPGTWNGMFRDPATAEKLYKGYMGLQKMASVNYDWALNHYTRPFFEKSGQYLLGGEQQRTEDQDNAKLVNALAEMTGRTMKEIDSRLKQMAWDPAITHAGREKAITDMIIKEGGVDVPLFKQMGLW